MPSLGGKSVQNAFEELLTFHQPSTFSVENAVTVRILSVSFFAIQNQPEAGWPLRDSLSGDGGAFTVL